MRSLYDGVRRTCRYPAYQSHVISAQVSFGSQDQYLGSPRVSTQMTLQTAITAIVQETRPEDPPDPHEGRSHKQLRSR